MGRNTSRRPHPHQPTYSKTSERALGIPAPTKDPGRDEEGSPCFPGTTDRWEKGERWDYVQQALSKVQREEPLSLEPCHKPDGCREVGCHVFLLPPVSKAEPLWWVMSVLENGIPCVPGPEFSRPPFLSLLLLAPH